MNSIKRSLSIVALLSAGFATQALAVTTRAATPTLTVVSGSVQLRGDEQICFRLGNTTASTDRITVRIRFRGTVPTGYLTLDGTRSEEFRSSSEEIRFVVDPRGVHRLAMRTNQRATVDLLTISSGESTVVQESCASYEFDGERRVDLDVEEPESVNRFETEAERLRREEDERRSREEAERLARIERDRERDIRDRETDDRYESERYRSGGVVPAGTEISMTLQNQIDTRSAYVGQGFTAMLSHDVVVDGRTLLPEGTRIEGHVIESKDAKRFGRSTLKLGFDKALLADGKTVALQGSVQRLGKGSAGKQGGIIAGSAIGGAILGKVLGGDDNDALLGAIIGGGIAAGSIGAKEGESIVIPAGTAMTISLDTSADVPAARTTR